MFGWGFDIMFNIIFFLAIGIFIFIIVQAVGRWSKNNQSPRLVVDAEIAAKRTAVSHHHHANAGDISGAHGYHTTMNTTYYATFQVQSGDRMEFSLSGHEFGQLREGDRGKLSFQGTRYLGFERS